jgi:hypothetical protein
LGIEVETVKAGKNHNKALYQWQNIFLDTIDYDSPAKIKKFEYRYD